MIKGLGSVIVTLSMAGIVFPADAALTSYFGLNSSGTGTAIADAANGTFVNAMSGLGMSFGTETFDAKPVNSPTPLAVSFGPAGTGTANGASDVVLSGNGGFGRFPISGLNYLDVSRVGFTVTFNTPVAAFGFYVTDAADSNGDFTMTLTDTVGNVSALNVGLTTNSLNDGSVLFFGFVDPTVRYVAIAFGTTTPLDTNADLIGLDNLTAGVIQEPATSVPEPLSSTLFIASLLGLAAARRGTVAIDRSPVMFCITN